MRRRPTRSAMRPATTSSAAKTTLYAFRIQDRSAMSVPGNERAMSGNAMLTIVTSRNATNAPTDVSAIAAGRAAREVDFGIRGAVSPSPRGAPIRPATARRYRWRDPVPLAGVRPGGEWHANSPIGRIGTGGARWDSDRSPNSETRIPFRNSTTADQAAVRTGVGPGLGLPRIAGAAHAVPGAIGQSELWSTFAGEHYKDNRIAQRIWEASGIETRHFVIDPRVEEHARLEHGAAHAPLPARGDAARPGGRRRRARARPVWTRATSGCSPSSPAPATSHRASTSCSRTSSGWRPTSRGC